MDLSDDDRFRRPGAGYEQEEPVAFAVIADGRAIDWSDPAHSPDSTLWLPESLFAELAAATTLGSIDVYAQTRLGPKECQTLCENLTALEATTGNVDLRTAAALVRERAHIVAASLEQQVLLVEGP